MRLRTFLDLFEMTQAEAVSVFQRLGVDPSGLDPAGLKAAYRKVIAQHHPDRGGDTQTAQQINAAYDVLKDNGAGPTEPHTQTYSGGGLGAKIGPYFYAPRYKTTRAAMTDSYTILISTAYDAYGLIGTEHNGILILNETQRLVVLDQWMVEPAGQAPSARQIDEFMRLKTLPEDQFIEFMVSNGRYREGSVTGADFLKQRQETVRRRQQRDADDYPAWAHAGYSGGMRNLAHIYRQDFRDINFIKKSLYEAGGREEWYVQGFDGNFFRGSWYAYANEGLFPMMAEAMVTWQTKGGNPYDCTMVFAERRSDPNRLYLIWSKDVPGLSKDPIQIDRDRVEDEELSQAANNRKLLHEVERRLAERRDHLRKDPNQYEMKFEAWAPKSRVETRGVELNFDDLYGKVFRVTDPVNNPDAPGFSVITPMDPWWNKAKDRPDYADIVRQRLNDPTFLPDHKYYQIVQTARRFRML